MSPYRLGSPEVKKYPQLDFGECQNIFRISPYVACSSQNIGMGLANEACLSTSYLRECHRVASDSSRQ